MLATASAATVVGGEVRRSATMPRHVRRMAPQSSTAARTSASTDPMRACSAARCSSVRMRSVSMCIHDSRRPSSVAILRSRPSASRLTERIGCSSRWTVRSASAIAAVTESTRKGESSVQICTIVRYDVHPFSVRVGVYTATRGSPGRRSSASFVSAVSAPVTSRGSRPSKLSDGSTRRSCSASTAAVIPGLVSRRRGPRRLGRARTG